MDQPQLQPIDTLMMDGFAKQMIKQFRAAAIYSTSVDQLRVLQRLQGNEPVEYPYIFLNVQQWSAASDRYNSNRLARQGVPVLLNSNGTQFHMARVIPANFDVEVTFHTNKYSGIDTSSVEGFARRWLFVRRNGSINFTVNYGLSNFPITYTVNESLPIPPRESQVDQESIYKITGTISIQGFVSEPILGTRGRVNQIILSDAVPTLQQPGERYFPFPEN